VSMIKEAHIGIGLYGHEGLRAVQSSDFAIGEFRFLWKLLLTHGRKAYRNNSELILYFLYKNLVMTIPEYYFAFVNGFSGQPIFADWNISFFNSIFTILPLMFRACYDHDTSTKQDGAATRQCIPHLYSSGPMRRYFNNSAYIRNFLLGSYHAAVVYFVPFYTYFETGIIDHEGKIGDLWAMSLCSYSVLIVIVSFNILLNSRQFTVLTLVGVGGSSIVLYGVWMYISDGYIP
jgi:magnesium-transporting ATPase (P-type)